jgi:formylglycine-generating enzyme
MKLPLLLIFMGLFGLNVACSDRDILQLSNLDCGLSSTKLGTFILVPAGSFVAGAKPFYPEEGPSMRLNVDAFEIQLHEVTNAQFSAFIAATGYVTDAETSSQSGRAEGGSGVFVRSAGSLAEGGQWLLVKGATWKTPEGPGSDIDGKGAFPVIHVSHRDAMQYAVWAKARLPSEVEWEYAAARGLPDEQNRRSSAYDKDGKARANTWQGIFPLADEGSDGFKGVAPVGCFQADRIGLLDMIGNVWEWTADDNPETGQAIVKGGSHLCADNFCGRYRPEARQFQNKDFSTNHIGFRVVRDLKPSNDQ